MAINHIEIASDKLRVSYDDADVDGLLREWRRRPRGREHVPVPIEPYAAFAQMISWIGFPDEQKARWKRRDALLADPWHKAYLAQAVRRFDLPEFARGPTEKRTKLVQTAIKRANQTINDAHKILAPIIKFDAGASFEEMGLERPTSINNIFQNWLPDPENFQRRRWPALRRIGHLALSIGTIGLPTSETATIETLNLSEDVRRRLSSIAPFRREFSSMMQFRPWVGLPDLTECAQK